MSIWRCFLRPYLFLVILFCHNTADDAQHAGYHGYYHEQHQQKNASKKNHDIHLKTPPFLLDLYLFNASQIQAKIHLKYLLIYQQLS